MNKIQAPHLKNLPAEKSVDNNPATRASAKDTREPRTLEAARMFEQEFLRHMVKEMRKTVSESDLISEGMGGKIFKEELDNKNVETWVNDQGGVGMADMIYDQVVQRVEDMRNRGAHAKAPGEALPLPPQKYPSQAATSALAASGVAQAQVEHGVASELLNPQHASFFMVKPGSKNPGQLSFELKSREPLQEKVDLRAPISGTVQQVELLEDGRQKITLEGDNSGPKLVSSFVHTGITKVRAGERISQGAPVAELPVSTHGEIAKAEFTMMSSRRN